MHFVNKVFSIFDELFEVLWLYAMNIMNSRSIFLYPSFPIIEKKNSSPHSIKSNYGLPPHKEDIFSGIWDWQNSIPSIKINSPISIALINAVFWVINKEAGDIILFIIFENF